MRCWPMQVGEANLSPSGARKRQFAPAVWTGPLGCAIAGQPRRLSPHEFREGQDSVNFPAACRFRDIPARHRNRSARRRPARHLRRTGAGINHSLLAQLLPGRQIMFATSALSVRGVGAAAVRAFGPLNAKPMQVFQHRLHEFRSTTLRIQVFVAKNELAVALDRACAAVQNVRAWPRCSRPVGEGARRPR